VDGYADASGGVRDASCRAGDTNDGHGARGE